MLSSGGQTGGRAGLRAGEVQGDHRGAGGHLRRDVRILKLGREECFVRKETVCFKPHEIYTASTYFDMLSPSIFALFFIFYLVSTIKIHGVYLYSLLEA